MRSPFKKQARPCTAEDARFLFLLLLGREPNSDAEIEPLLELSFFGATKRVLLSLPFTQTVIDPFMLGKRPMQKQWGTTAAKLIAGAAKSHFGVKLDPTDSSKWPQCLADCLQSERVQKAFLKAFSVDRLQYLHDHLSELETNAPVVEANLRQTRGTIIEGQITQPNGGGSVTLDLFLNGRAAGSTTAKRNASGFLGFEHRLEWPGDASPYEATLMVFERNSGVMACPPKEVILNLAEATGLLARVQSAIEAFEDTGASSADLSNKAWLTTLDRITNLRLEDYHLYKQLYQPPLEVPRDESLSIGVILAEHSEAGFKKANSRLRAQTFANYRPFASISDALESDCQLIVSLAEHEELHPRALAQIADEAAASPEALFFRFGHDYFNGTQYHSPFLVAKFDPLILQQMPSYAAGFAMRREIAQACIAAKSVSELWLQVHQANGPSAFAEIPEVLLSRHCQPQADMLSKLEQPAFDPSQKLSIIIPTKDKLPLLEACVESLQNTIELGNATEIVIVNNNSEEDETLAWLGSVSEQSKDRVAVRVLTDERAFNWAALNNAASRDSEADILLFLNNDTQALDKGWDIELRQLLAQPDVEVVGAKLLFGDRSIQHAGAILHADGRIKHEALGFAEDAPGYQNRLLLTRNCDAVTGAFMACSKQHFDAVGGFDEESFAVTYNDIDFCLATRQLNRNVVFSPEIKFLHLESQSRGLDSEPENRARELEERGRLLNKWAPNQLMDAWLPIQLAYEPGQQNLILKRVTKTLESSPEKRQKGVQ